MKTNAELLLSQLRAMKQRRVISDATALRSAAESENTASIMDREAGEAPCGQCGLAGPHTCLPRQRDATVTDADACWLCGDEAQQGRGPGGRICKPCDDEATRQEHFDTHRRLTMTTTTRTETEIAHPDRLANADLLTSKMMALGLTVIRKKDNMTRLVVQARHDINAEVTVWCWRMKTEVLPRGAARSVHFSTMGHDANEITGKIVAKVVALLA